ncbi:hydroxyacylglutathione hydrolase [Saccharopolyspora erythraea NRRL 2338]|uniref:MBL fold metallo-hydrolase n=2 Tax=Saccharopolyspora erythraea TaxID=1836 RepID=A0ABN1C1S5_SACER|nr:MBL fold metallo-hydrolase [Saccharopolyspora erythraea]EQD83212.1 Zn-dependent hydrolase [Saccharopolyspora erythraea D]PFG97438.1 hydroxyacylglutathione hydrolase [Saccharopolyspora erythraea NRRL 2338]QRK87617.1 MBL fold metallo-hydrolase [Saccharopolyspora erythraea]CAM03758.1 probable hydroxyacylglutathione hydrolase [Saccharopolyspora erythraea NRRL 2338]
MAARIDHTVTSGTFSLDGGTYDVDNNVWVVGDDQECVVIDAPHDAAAIRELVGGRDVVAVLCTHAHDDHVRVAPALAEQVGAPVLLHPEDQVLWDLTHPDSKPDGELADGQVVHVAGIEVRVLHTPGHAPGAVCLHVPALATVFTGDTLFAGGPGATGRSYSNYDVIVDSIRDRLLPLPEETEVRPGHGESTTIGAVRSQFEEWVARG